MKQKIRVILLYGAAFLLTASISAGYRFCYGKPLLIDFSGQMSRQMNFNDYGWLISVLLKPTVITWLCGITVFGCCSAGVNCILHGIYLGGIAIGYCRSAHSPFTHAGIFLILLIFMLNDCLFAVDICRCRSGLRTVIPDPKAIIRQPCVRRMTEHFLTGGGVIVSFGSALYLLLHYFPL